MFIRIFFSDSPKLFIGPCPERVKNIYFSEYNRCHWHKPSLAKIPLLIICVIFSFIHGQRNTSLMFHLYFALIKLTKPAIVSTLLDNTKWVQDLDKIFHNKLTFLTFQNGIRHRQLDGHIIRASDIFHSNLGVFNRTEIFWYKKYNATVKSFKIVGSLRYKSWEIAHKGELKRDEYDIFLPSNYTNNPNYHSHYKDVLTYISQFSKIQCLKTVIVTRCAESDDGYENEVNFFKHYLPDAQILPNVRYSGEVVYNIAGRSKVTIAINSTVVGEVLQAGRFGIWVASTCKVKNFRPPVPGPWAQGIDDNLGNELRSIIFESKWSHEGVEKLQHYWFVSDGAQF